MEAASSYSRKYRSAIIRIVICTGMLFLISNFSFAAGEDIFGDPTSNDSAIGIGWPPDDDSSNNSGFPTPDPYSTSGSTGFMWPPTSDVGMPTAPTPEPTPEPWPGDEQGWPPPDDAVTPMPTPTPMPQPSPGGTQWPPAGWPPSVGWNNPDSTPDEPTPTPNEPDPNTGDDKPGDGNQHQGWPPPETKTMVLEGKTLGWVIDPETVYIHRNSHIYFNPKLYIGDAFQGQAVDSYGLVMAGDQFYTVKYDSNQKPYFELFNGQVEKYGSTMINSNIWNCPIINSLLIDTDILLDENVVFYYGISPVGDFSNIRFGAVTFDVGVD